MSHTDLARAPGFLGPRRRSAVSEVVAALALVVIVISAAVVVLLFGLGVIQSLISGGVNTPLAASGQMTVPGTTGQVGVLTLTVKDTQTIAISRIDVSCPASFAVVPCVTMGVTGPGGTVVGTNQVVAATGSTFVAGTIYSIILKVTFTTGSVLTVDVSVAAVS